MLPRAGAADQQAQASTSQYPNPKLHRTRSPSSQAEGQDGGGGGSSGKKRVQKRRKVNHACLYCRRSHMTCDEGRPCQRCIKREIGHLCHDEARQPKPSLDRRSSTMDSVMSARDDDMNMSIRAHASNAPKMQQMQPPPARSMPTLPPQVAPAQSIHNQAPWPVQLQSQAGFMYQPETLGNEFSVLSDFLDTLDDHSFFTSPQAAQPGPSLAQNSFQMPSVPQQQQLQGVAQTQQDPSPIAQIPTPTSSSNLSVAGGMVDTSNNNMINAPASTPSSYLHPSPDTNATSSSGNSRENLPTMGSTTANEKPQEEKQPILIPAATKTERYLITAADQESGSRDERLNRVIRSKYEAGLLKPYNYVKGYARLSRWMDRNVSQESKQQILQPLSVLRPKFRAVAQSLRDIDLVFIEEAFERLLLDYDRVFSAMGVAACLWRRTGEIYKGNREFAELVGVDGMMLREGRLCIYELMAEESAVNYWDQYGQVAFDVSQKAVLTSCALRFRPNLAFSTATPANTTKSSATAQASSPPEQGFVSCCFSFTIRRDTWGIPSMIVGNFIKC